MTKALYRKYRPTNLSEVVGQDHIVKVLLNSLKTNKISHAYLFTGPRGTGKTSIARIFAHEINDFKYELEDNYLDIIEIDAASNTGVDNIRELREKATIAPTKGKYKIYIIDEVHMLSKSAFNALLKTLEEPPEHVIFIMATTDFEKVPVTITSRSQIFNFKLAEPNVMKDHLRKISDLEKINIDDDALEIIVSRGGGSFRDSLSLLDQISTFSDSRITADLINSALGLPASQKIQKLLETYQTGVFSAITNSIKSLLESGAKPELLAELAIKEIIKNPKQELLPLLQKLPSVANPFPEAKFLLAFTSGQPTQITRAFTTQKTSMPTVEKTPVVTEKTPISAKKEDINTNQPTINSNVAQNFDWENFKNEVRSNNALLYSYLKKTTYSYENSVLNLCPDKPVVKTILEKTNNYAILLAHLPNGASLNICDPSDAKKDSTISQISDIMGSIQEVNTNGGEIPF